MSMSRKDFVSLASELEYTKPTLNPGVEVGSAEHSRYEAELWMWKRCVEAVSKGCRGSNDRFDAGRFESACGLED